MTMTMSMKLLRVLLAVLVGMLFIDSVGADPGVAHVLLDSFGGYKEVVVAGLIAWLVYPMFNESL